jgi:hypothetical protein
MVSLTKKISPLDSSDVEFISELIHYDVEKVLLRPKKAFLYQVCHIIVRHCLGGFYVI